MDLSSFFDKPEAPKEEKKSIWKSISSNRKKPQNDKQEAEDNKKKWGFSDKQKDAIKGGMGRFSNMIKSAAAKGSSVLKKKVEEPAEFPEFDSGELMLGMKAQPVQYFFANWNYPDEEKKMFHEWIGKVVEHQVLDESHQTGFTVENGSFFAEEGFRTCLVPLLNMRDDVNVDFSEIPSENGTFVLTIRVSNKPNALDDLLSGF